MKKRNPEEGPDVKLMEDFDSTQFSDELIAYIFYINFMMFDDPSIYTYCF